MEKLAQEMKRPLPSGTVAFLFSDIEGSTTRWDTHHDAMQEALRRHDAFVRAAVERHDGQVFKTIGDAFCVVFPTVPQAVAAALDAQRALHAEDFAAVDGLRVRIALHAGHADERESDYFGPALNRVARLLSIGHGGQILLSGVAKELVEGSLPPQASLRDLGLRRLKDLSKPERVYQLLAPDLPSEFPALRSLDEMPNNLPLQLTRFIGRDDEVAAVKTLLQESRLVTLIGAGGIGKTRLAVQVGADLLDGSTDGVWFVDLAPLRDPKVVPSAVAELFEVTESAGRSLAESLVSALRTKRMLLIFDNCEHVVDEAAALIAALCGGCPEVRVLATSRQSLGVSGEQTHHVASLAVPGEHAALSPEDALRYGAVMLFVDRAKLATGSFALTDENAPVVARICRRLDGIALAIELAAPRLKMLSPQQLEERLSERFRVLTGGSRMAVPRQQTMRALIDWSFDLLEDEEKRLFAGLGVFAGDFSLEAAGAISADGVPDEWQVLELLASLVDKSLVTSELHAEAQRYRLLESMRAYSLEKAAEAADLAHGYRRHAAYYAALAERSQAAFATTPSTAAWIGELDPELENFRAALAWALDERGDVDLGARLLTALRTFWLVRGFAPEAAARAENALSLACDLPQNLRAALWLTLAQASCWLALYAKTLQAAENARELYEALGDRAGVALALTYRGQARSGLGQASEAEADLGDSLALFRELGDERHAAGALHAIATALAFSGRFEESRAALLEVLELQRALGHDLNIRFTLSHLAETEFALGDAQGAIVRSRELLATGLLDNDLSAKALEENNLAAYLLALEKIDEASAIAREALRDGADVGDHGGVTIAIQHLASTFARNDPRRAARLLGFVGAAFAATEYRRQNPEQHTYDSLLARLHEALTKDEITELARTGARMDEKQAVAEATA